MLSAQGLSVALPDRSRKSLLGGSPLVEILHDVDLEVRAGECVGIVGESGSGKSTLARTLVRLYRPTRGRLIFEGIEIQNATQEQLRPMRSRMQMVFQDSQSSLNPRLSIESILAEPFLAHDKACSKKDARQRAAALIEDIGLTTEFLSRYPHQLSGGQRQRIGLARAMALRPSLIVADEIVSGLDVSVQARILGILEDLRLRRGIAVVLISHDLSVVRTVCQRIIVMRQGAIVEAGDVESVFAAPRCSYTRRLIRAIPLPEVDRQWIRDIEVDESVEEAAGQR